VPPIAAIHIYYGDGTVAEDWESSPDENVQVVVWLHEGGGVTWSWGVDTYTFPGSDRVKHGKAIPDADFFAIWESAQQAHG
jgi:hypothetical protein